MAVLRHTFLRHTELGLGKAGTSGTIRFFDGPASGEVVLPLLPGLASRAVLEVQQRVWWRNGGRWMAGHVATVADREGGSYFVAFPNAVTRQVPSEELFVRWTRPLPDPVGLLQAGIAETPYFYGRRSEFVKSVLRQQAGSHGLAGLLSSGIQLYAHQIGAARRILNDPVRRYLLADEVGLGKTIEAGMVLRQLLRDLPGEALVLVPDPLVGQWAEELNAKFRTWQFGSRVKVYAHNDLLRLEPTERMLVIVDEVHRLTGHGSQLLPGDQRDRYERLCAIAHSSAALLLLSATPVRSNEDGFLRMLHLLDPGTYPLSDAAAFRHRVEIRDDLATALSALGDDTPLPYLAEPVADLRRLVPDSGPLANDLDQLEQAIASDAEDAARQIARRVRTRLGETHRIHRRMIRTRRTASIAKAFPVRGRSKAAVWQVPDRDPRRAEVMRVIDSLRSVLMDSRADGPAILRTVLGRALAPLSALRDLAIALRGGAENDLDEEEITSLRGVIGTDHAAWLAGALEAVIALDEDNDRFSAMINWVWPLTVAHKVAVVCSFPTTARQAADRLRAHFGKDRVALLISGMPETERSANLTAFMSGSSRNILILDRSAEEGTNLQAVEYLLHLDTPTSSARLEQRLGRFDRWWGIPEKAVKPIQSVIFTEADSEVDRHLGAWLRGLDQGLELLDRSSATLQYLLPQIEREFFASALTAGLAQAGAALIDRREEFSRHRRRIESQDLLDALEDRGDDERFVADLIAADDGTAIHEAFHGYVVGVLGFTSAEEASGTRYGISSLNSPRMTESEVRALGAVSLRLAYTSARTSAATSRGFLRWGEPLVDAFHRLAIADDRGRCFIVEVPQPNRPPDLEPLYFYCFDVVVNADVDPIGKLDEDDSHSAAAARAHLVRLLPPTIERVWWRPGRGEPGPSLCQALEQANGINLGSRPDRFDALTTGSTWSDMCEEAAREALRTVARRASVQTRIQQASDGLSAIRMAHEIAADARPHQQEDNSATWRMSRALGAAIDNPRLEIAGCGVVIVTSLQEQR